MDRSRNQNLLSSHVINASSGRTGARTNSNGNTDAAESDIDSSTIQKTTEGLLPTLQLSKFRDHRTAFFTKVEETKSNPATQPKFIVESFLDGKFEAKILDAHVDLFRYYIPGEDNGLPGHQLPRKYSFLTTEKFASGTEAAVGLGLARWETNEHGKKVPVEINVPTHVDVYRVPEGTLALVGKVAPLFLRDGTELGAEGSQLVVVGAAKSWKISSDTLPHD